MKSLLSATVLLFGLARPAVAQDPMPDTLDWHAYYPLQVGNAWEWVTDLQFFYHTVDRHEIVGDTLIDGQQYFIRLHIQSGTEAGDQWVRVDTTLVRYGSTTVLVRTYTSEAEEWEYLCDMGADFESVVACPLTGNMFVSGGYADDGECLAFGTACAPYRARKLFVTMAGSAGGTFYHGIGRLPGIPEGAQGGVDLTYVRVNGQEYGERAVYLGREELPRQPTFRFGIYPNPARDRAWLTLPETGRPYSVTVYDVLGRRNLDRQSCEPGACELAVDHLPPGLYIARVSAADGSERSGPFIIRR